MSTVEGEPELDHYVTRIVVERVDKLTDTQGSGSYAKKITVGRRVTELASIVVKDISIAGIQNKVSAHVSLVEDYETQSTT